LFPLADPRQLKPMFNISNFYANVISFEEDDFSLPIDSEGVLNIEAA
jgi:hypothetical protein